MTDVAAVELEADFPLQAANKRTAKPKKQAGKACLFNISLLHGYRMRYHGAEEIALLVPLLR